MKYLLIVLMLAGCSTGQPVARLRIKDYIVMQEFTVCSAADETKTIVWSCK
jgi:hypothetical protein